MVRKDQLGLGAPANRSLTAPQSFSNQDAQVKFTAATDGKAIRGVVSSSRRATFGEQLPLELSRN